MRRLLVVALSMPLLLTACGGQTDRSNRDPKQGYVYLYSSGDDGKVCNGPNLLYYTYCGGHYNQSLAVVENSPECAA